MLEENEDDDYCTVPPPNGVSKIYHASPYNERQNARPQKSTWCKKFPLCYGQDNCKQRKSASVRKSEFERQGLTFLPYAFLVLLQFLFILMSTGLMQKQLTWTLQQIWSSKTRADLQICRRPASRILWAALRLFWHKLSICTFSSTPLSKTRHTCKAHDFKLSDKQIPEQISGIFHGICMARWCIYGSGFCQNRNDMRPFGLLGRFAACQGVCGRVSRIHSFVVLFSEV